MKKLKMADTTVTPPCFRTEDTHEPSKKKRKTQYTKATLLSELDFIIEEMKRLEHERLRKQLETLRRNLVVVTVSKNMELRIKNLHEERKKDIDFEVKGGNLEAQNVPSGFKVNMAETEPPIPIHEPPNEESEFEYHKTLLLSQLKSSEKERDKLGLKIKDLEIKNLRKEESLQEKVHKLQEEQKDLKTTQKKLQNALDLAQITWVWEAHVARFVVDPSTPIFPRGKFRQMENHVEKLGNKRNLWEEIQSKLTKWTKEHKTAVKTVRVDRNSIVHAANMNLDLIEYQMEHEINPEDQTRLKDMLEMLKMIASLMKFGRLAKFYDLNKDLFPTPDANGNGMDESALKDMMSWDRDFDQIDGLQCIEHTKAELYLAKFVDHPDRYFSIVDFIKNENRKRLGKLAWKMEASGILVDLTKEHNDALSQLKDLLPDPNEEIEELDGTIATLHVPDFLKKNLWKYGIEIIEKVMTPASLKKFGQLANFYAKNKHMFPIRGGGDNMFNKFALEKMISWDGTFSEVNGLQHISCTEAKAHVAKYLTKNQVDCRNLDEYVFIIDCIKDRNKKRLGKLAWMIKAPSILGDLSPMHREALDELKKLLPDGKGKSKVLDQAIAKLHIPDFLPKYLWKHGIEIIEKYHQE